MTKITRIQVPIPYPVKWVNCYYIADSVPTLIDTGVNTEEGLETIKSAIEAQRGKLGDLRRIITTHGHMDHIGLTGRIAEISGAEVFVHPWDSIQWVANPDEQLIDIRENYRKFFAEAGIPKDLADELIQVVFARHRGMCNPIAAETPISEGMVFGFDDLELQAIHTPGHSAGSVCLLNRADGTLFTGDTLLTEIFPNPAMRKTGSGGYKSLTEHRASLDRINGLAAKRILPGHGRTFEDLATRIRRIRDQHAKRSKEVHRILAQGEKIAKKKAGMTQFMVATELFGPLSGIEVFYGISATEGHLDALEEQGLAARVKEGSHYCYRLQD
ncbi:MAG: MBL fold metallo-hydrolase [Desulfomonile tiedjei]|nr:MBL fold metallo-hydrolase [Desulfomonile tiedjei]